MKLAILSALAFSGVLLAAGAASAAPVTFDWSYNGGGPNVGSGTLTATLVSGVTYSIDTISGTANGQTIGVLDNYDGSDNFLYYPAVAQVDTLGFSFSVGVDSYNLYEDFGNYATDSPYYCDSEYCLIGPGTFGAGDPVAAVDFSATPAPEPFTLSLFGAGLAGAAALRRRKKA